MVQENLISVGSGSYILASRIVGILSPKSSPMRRLREEAKAENKLIDVTHGKPTRSILVLDSNHIVLSSTSSDTMRQRFLASFQSMDGAMDETGQYSE